MNDMTKTELRLMATLLTGLAEGLLSVCKQNKISVGTIEYQQDGESSGEYSVDELITMCREKLGIGFEAQAVRKEPTP